MAFTVRKYQKHLNDQLVTVVGSAPKRKSLYPNVPPKYAPVHRQNVVRLAPVTESVPGTYIQPNPLRGIGGKTKYLYQPGAPDRDTVEYRNRKNNLSPICGAYIVPKKKKW